MPTTGDPAGPGTAGLDYGITTIQGVSQRIWANLAPGPPATAMRTVSRPSWTAAGTGTI